MRPASIRWEASRGNHALIASAARSARPATSAGSGKARAIAVFRSERADEAVAALSPSTDITPAFRSGPYQVFQGGRPARAPSARAYLLSGAFGPRRSW